MPKRNGRLPKRGGTVSEPLRKAVKAYHSIYALSRDSGVPQSMLLRFASRERGLSLATVDALCEFFGMQLTEPAMKSPGK